MKNENKKLEIKKDQLFPEYSFIRFCNEDRASTYAGGRMDINERFLRAAEKDELLKPIQQIQERLKQGDGTEKEVLVNYYSPHQIYILAELRKNIIDEDGGLCAPDSVDWHKERPKEDRPRYIAWGTGMSFWAQDPKKRDREREEYELFVGAHLISDYLHNFLELLHGLEQPDLSYYPIEKRRYWDNVPKTEYNFDPLKKDSKKLLQVYDLDEKKLNTLRRIVGQFAETIDPLANWHYYIEKHPEWQKDLLKGDASLAQEIYCLYNLLTKTWETITQNKSEPIFDFIHQDFPHHPSWRPEEYVSGEDTKALKYSIEQFDKWKIKKENKSFVGKKIKEKIKKIEKDIALYENIYGHKSYAGSTRDIEPEDKLKVENLDEDTKKYILGFLKTKKDTDEKWDEKLKDEISMAIMFRLGDLQRELSQAFSDISKQFNDKRIDAWNREREFGNWWWMKNRERIKDLPHVEQVKLMHKERREIVKEAKYWESREADFHKSVSWYSNTVFCKSCEKKPVKQRSETNIIYAWKDNNYTICDDCFANINQKSLTADDEWWKKITQAEWKCSCVKKNYKGESTNPMLYKFAYGNMATLKTQAGVPIKFTALYGKFLLEAQCQNCGKLNKRLVEWGWMP